MIESTIRDNKDEFRQVFKEGFHRRGEHKLPNEKVADQLFNDWYENEYIPNLVGTHE